MKYDLGILEDYTERGLLRKSENDDLVQYNYTEKVNNAPMGELWDEITRFNRGNVYEKKTGELIARAMPKFLNIGQHSAEECERILSEKNIHVTEKLDGCLGILYTYKDKLFCNSRGGFNNHVTEKMKELVPKYTMVKTLCRTNTLNVEVISPVTRIICDYGDTDELNLITAFYRHNQSEYSYEDLALLGRILRMPLVKQVNMTWDELIHWAENADYTKEGFVVRLPNGQRVKVKSNEYLNIAKFRCGLNRSHIYKLIKLSIMEKKDYLQEMYANIPDEFTQEAKQIEQEIRIELQKYKDECYDEYNKMKGVDNRDLPKMGCKHLSGIYAIRSGKEDSLDRIYIKLIDVYNIGKDSEQKTE